MKLSPSVGVINLQTYSRPHLLSKCLSAIYSMEHSMEYDKIVVLQVGNKKVEELVYEFADNRTQILEVDGRNRTPLQNMNFNRWMALENAFSSPKRKWVFSIEEDVEVSRESLIFIDQVYRTYSTNRKFRGINLGSILSDPELIDTYSLQRFGVHGCGSVLTRKTWSIVKWSGVRSTLNKYPLDSAIEGIAKNGFMVTPNITMYLDNGWDSGTHNQSSGNEPHYVMNRESWKLRTSTFTEYFREYTTPIPWRYDCVLFEPKDNFKYLLKSWLWQFNHFAIFRALFNSLRQILKVIKTILNRIGF